MLSRIAAVILGKILQNLFSTFLFYLLLLSVEHNFTQTEGLVLTLTNLLLCIHPPWVQAKLQFPFYFCISQESPHYFPSHTNQLLKYIISKILTHPTVSRTEEISLKTVVHRREIAVEREMAKTSCFRPPWNGLSASPMLSSQWIGNLYGVTFPKSKNDKSWCVQGSSFLCHQSVILFFFCVGTKNR